MIGVDENHNTIALNLATELRRAARGTDCRTFISDMKLHLAELNRFYYPDILQLECLELALGMGAVYEDVFELQGQ